ncbi:MAG: hypothetical protein ACRCXG_11165 [Vibrio sp.]
MIFNRALDALKALSFSLYMLLPFFLEYLVNNFNIDSYIVYIILLFVVLLFFVDFKPFVNVYLLAYLVFFSVVNMMVFFYAENVQSKYILSFFLAMVLSLVFISQRRYNFLLNIPGFVFYISIIAIPIAAGGVYQGIHLFLLDTRMGFNVNPLSLAVLSGFSIISFSYKKRAFFDFILLLVPIFGFIVSASKGPLIAILILWMCTRSKQVSFFSKLVISSVIAFIGAVFIASARGGIITDNSVGIRTYLYDVSFELISKNVFIPEELDAFGIVTGIDYPHNIFLDVWMRSGFLSLLFLISMIVILLCISFFGKKYNVLNSFSLYLIFVMMFSFSYYDMVKILIPLSFMSISYYFYDLRLALLHNSRELNQKLTI